MNDDQIPYVKITEKGAWVLARIKQLADEHGGRPHEYMKQAAAEWDASRGD